MAVLVMTINPQSDLRITSGSVMNKGRNPLGELVGN